ncbi:uncharacterized protein LOC109404900 [Aedes albopictus]|uniref:Uncharacterized protein n=1 Tax=Aedes albopictus TaxID=7160 RepID=A0ABM1XSH9_AEDAL|nr:uncharacterized protein LOC109404900 [Aedes albopictus]
MSSKSCHLLPSLPAMTRVLLMLLALLLASAAAHRFTSQEAAAAGGAPTSGDKMSSADGSEPPRRFHAIFQGSSAAAAAALPELKSSPSSLEKMLAGSSSSSSRRSKVAVDNSTNDNGSSQKNRTRQCREGCLGKRSIKDILCTQQRECAMCWDVCNRNHQIRKENELAHRLLLSLSRMIRNESVVAADIEWTTPEELLEHQPHAGVPSPLAASENVERLSRIARDGGGPNGTSVSKIIQALSQASSLMGPESKTVTSSSGSSSSSEQSFHQCLVSWEISGGGLTGNLLTETAKVELSLWPNTKYNVHVTCRNKETDQLIRSAPLLIDTREALVVSLHGTTTTSSTPTTTTTTTTKTTTTRPLAINSVIEEIEVVQEAAAFESASDDVDAEADSYSTAAGNSYQTKPRSNPSGHNLWPIYSATVELPENSKEVLILGVFVALLAFVLIVLTVVILIRRKHDHIEDRELLIESEVLPKILHV